MIMQCRMGSDRERKYEIPRISMSCLTESDYERESSLNPYALEFIPSHLKSGRSDNGDRKLWNNHEMKNEATSTTTLVEHEAVRDASQRKIAQRQIVQRQLYKMMHQMGEQLVPLKSINISLSTDGQGVNVYFKAHQPSTVKQMLDENLCNDSALKLDMSDCAFIPRHLPNVLAAKFVLRMGDILNEKIKWNEQNEETSSTSSTSSSSSSTNASQLTSSGQLLDTKSSMASKLSMVSKCSSDHKLATKKEDESRSMQLSAQTTSKESVQLLAQTTSKESVQLLAQTTSKESVQLLAQTTSKESVQLLAQTTSKESMQLSAKTSKESMQLPAQATSKESMQLPAQATSKESMQLPAQATSKESMHLSDQATSKESVQLLAQTTSKESIQLSAQTTSKESMQLSAQTTSKESIQLSAQAKSKDSLPKKRSNHVIAPSLGNANKARSTTSSINGSRGLRSNGIAGSDAKLEKSSSKGIHSPQQNIGQNIKKGVNNKTFQPRSTHTSQMRQSQVQKTHRTTTSAIVATVA